MSEEDAKRVEESTGKSVEELSDEDVAAAASDLGIQTQQLTPEEKALVEKAEAEAEEEED
ncbi:MAG: hypothetical protein ACE5I4_03160 [Thermoplasmata archaeon]